MKQMLKSFSINDINDFRDDEDVDFAIAKVKFISTGNTSYNNSFSEEVLKEYAQTAKGKLIVAHFDKFSKDVTTHVPKEVIVGYVDPCIDIEFEEDEHEQGKIWAVATAKISKIYATEVYNLFKENNFRNVSMEFSCTTERPEDDPRAVQEEENPVTAFNVHGITILGLRYNPACSQAEIKIKRFAEQATHSTLKEFAENRKKNIDKGSEKMSEVVKEFEEPVEETKELETPQEEEKELEEPCDDEKCLEEPKEEEKELSDEEDKADDTDESKEEDKEESKEFSLDANLDMAAVMALLENETEEYRGLADELWECKDYVMVMSKCLSYAKELSECQKELAELKEFKQTTDDKAKAFSVKAQLDDVAEDLTEEQVKAFSEEANGYSLEEISVWANKVKAFAYEASKGKKTPKKVKEFTRIASDKQFEEKPSKAITADDVFKKYL